MANVASRGPRMSLEEWAERTDRRGELSDGYLEEEEAAGWVHEVVVAWLIEVLRGWLRPRGGSVGGSNTDLATGPSQGRHPDVIAYFAGRRPPPRGPVRLAPDIVVEVVSETPRDQRRDRRTKREEYAAVGVRYYWLVDPQIRLIEILELGPDGRYVIAASAEAGRMAAVPGCDGLVIDLDALWSEVDEANSPTS